MRKSLAIVISCIVLLVWWFCQNLHVKAQGGAGATCVTHMVGDVNGDETVDISDPVYLLQNLFRGGPQPCALAGGCDVCLTPEQAQMLDDIAFGRKIAGTFRYLNPNPMGGVNKGLIAFSADGVGLCSDWTQFGYFPAGFMEHFRSSDYMTWERTGPLQIRYRTAGMNFAEDGTPVNVWETYGEVTFADESFSAFTGSFDFRSCRFDSWSPTGGRLPRSQGQLAARYSVRRKTSWSANSLLRGLMALSDASGPDPPSACRPERWLASFP